MTRWQHFITPTKKSMSAAAGMMPATTADMLFPVQSLWQICSLPMMPNPEMFSDSIGIPESGNGVPDVLDEARYELEWMLKMQDSETGGVHHKVSCENFPGYVMPENGNGRTDRDAGFHHGDCRLLRRDGDGIRVLSEGGSRTFAETCLDAAKKAWAFLQKNPNFIFSNPSDITTGDYGDSSDTDERYWAAAQMWRATGEDTYRSASGKACACRPAWTGWKWATTATSPSSPWTAWIPNSDALHPCKDVRFCKSADKCKGPWRRMTLTGCRWRNITGAATWALPLPA